MRRYLALGFVMVLAATPALAQSTSRNPRVAPRPRLSPTLQLLNQRIPEVSFVDAPFEQVMEWVQEYTKANIVVRWEKLVDAGVERDKPISIKVKNLELSMVLWMILNEAGGTDVKLAYRASGSLLILSTVEDLGQEMVVKVYDVTDLLVNVPRFDNAPQIDPSQALQGASGGGGGGGTSVFSGGNTEDQDEENNQGVIAPGMPELIQLIVDTVEPDTWALNGGKGTITPYRYQIVVRNSILVHQRLAGYIEEE